MFSGMGRFLILCGVFLILSGVFLSLKGNIPWLGRLPGDIFVKKYNLSFYFPLTTCFLASILLSLFFYLFRR